MTNFMLLKLKSFYISLIIEVLLISIFFFRKDLIKSDLIHDLNEK